MKKLTRRTAIILATTLCLLLLALQCSCSSSFIEDVEPCYVNVIKSKLVFYNATQEIFKCCDSWCTSYCPFNITVTLNMTTYFTEKQCCPGYQGVDCIPHCSTPCGLNKQCSQPEQCTCIEGWSGPECQQVANLTQSNVTSSSVQLSWLSPANSNDNGYFLYCTTTNSLQTHNKTIPSGQNTSIISGLKPYTSYRCCVIPLLIVGNGTESCLPDHVITSEDVPSTAPNNVMILNTFNSSLLIKWSPPSIPNGPIINYTLYITHNSNNTVDIVTIDGQFIFYLLNGVSLNESIQVTVSATTTGGEGPHSSAIVKVLDSLVLLTPFIYDIGSDGDSYLSVTPSPQVYSSLANIIWSPPISLQNVASYYVLTMTSREGLMQHGRHWTIGPRQTFNLTLLIEPFVPHLLNATIVTNDAKTGTISSHVFFSREGVPKVSPLIGTISRTTPTKGHVTWSPLTLDVSRGVVTNYTIKLLQSTSNASCGSVIEDSSGFISTTDRQSIELEDLSVNLPYCVSILGTTNVGSGPYSIAHLIPTYESSEFCMVLRGVYNCSTWILTDLNEKLSNLSITTVNILNSACSSSSSSPSCGVSVGNIAPSSNHVSCLTDDNINSVKYCSRLIGTTNVSSLELIQLLKEWNINNPSTSIILSGLSLGLTSVCNSENANCTDVGDTGPASGTDYYKVTTLILSISLILVLVFQVLTCVVLISYCNKYYSKKSKEALYNLPPRLSLYQSSISGDSVRTGSDSPDTQMSPPSLITRSTNSTV